MDANLYADVVKYYPYRTANVVDRVFSLEFRPGDAVHMLREILADGCGRRPDNHECYMVRKTLGTVLYVQFSDFHMYVGLGIIEEPW